MRDDDECPYFYCLLEDDALITEVAVTTDTLRPTDFDFENSICALKVSELYKKENYL